MIIRIDPASAVPPFEQLRAQLATMIESGVLEVGHRLPTVRQLAKDLALANGTVARAYHELELADLVVTAGRHGTLVHHPTTMSTVERRSKLREAAEHFTRTVAQLGATSSDAANALAGAGLPVHETAHER